MQIIQSAYLIPKIKLPWIIDGIFVTKKRLLRLGTQFLEYAVCF
jgi:hypothetical protein